MARPEPVVILCGGRGTRLQERTHDIPKPLVEIGGRPILWHVVDLYARQGFGRFILCTGYKGELIEDFVNGRPWEAELDVVCADTGLETPTGGRIAAVGDRISGGTFCATYSDGLADIDFDALLGAHARHGDAATMTVVRPELQFGVCRIGADGRIDGFHEKPRSDHWINGGFFCLEPSALSYIGRDSVLEEEPLERLAADGQLHAHRHEGFWECMDTYKDAVQLNELWASGQPPWRVTEVRA